MSDGSGTMTGKGSTTTMTLTLAVDFAATSTAARKAASPADVPSVATRMGPDGAGLRGGDEPWVAASCRGAVGSDMGRSPGELPFGGRRTPPSKGRKMINLSRIRFHQQH